MTHEENAFRFWPLLVFAAQTRRIITYSELEAATGVHHHVQHDPLYRVFCRCEQMKIPRLTAIVVNAKTRLPGPGYPEQGTNINPLEILKEQSEVLAFDWASHPQPTVDQLRIRSAAAGPT